VEKVPNKENFPAMQKKAGERGKSRSVYWNIRILLANQTY
jgi:hypothetical protein